MNKIRTIIGKEWREVFKNRLVLFSVVFLPLIFIAMPILTLVATGSEGAADSTGTVPGELGEAAELPGTAELCAGLSELECVEAYTLNLFSFMFMILPVAIPVSIAAYSIVGEKASRSLEPLLATPITTVELLLGKGLAATLPALFATWFSYILYAILVLFLAGPAQARVVVQPVWLLAIFIVGPLLTVLAVSVAVMISSRVTDPRAAEQLATLVMLPIILLVVGQSVGLVLLNQDLVLLLGAVVLVLDIVMVYLAIQVFQRERILTKWK